MKIYINCYRYHWLSPYTILDKVLFWKDNVYDDKPPKWLSLICELLQKFLDIIHPKIDYVKIDPWDTWSADHTLATIIVPLLKQLKKEHYGSPLSDDEDVPEELRSYNSEGYSPENEWDIDENIHKRWDWILDEIIWTFENILDDDWENLCYTDGDFDRVKYEEYGNRIENGLRLFGKYYRSMWS